MSTKNAETWRRPMRWAFLLGGSSLCGLGNSYFDIPFGGYLLVSFGGVAIGIGVAMAWRRP